jgi:hypothetical protein
MTRPATVVLRGDVREGGAARAALAAAVADLAEDLGLPLQAEVEVHAGARRPALSIGGRLVPLIEPPPADADDAASLVTALHAHREALVAPGLVEAVRAGRHRARAADAQARVELIMSPGDAASPPSPLDHVLFRRIGLLVPPATQAVDPALAPGWFRVRLNDLRWPAERGDADARAQRACELATAHAAHLLTPAAVSCLLDLLHDEHPVLVDTVHQRVELPLLTALLRTLLADRVPITDLRAILEAMLLAHGMQSVPVPLTLADYKREARHALRHAIAAPHQVRGTLHVHLLAEVLQARLARGEPLSPTKVMALHAELAARAAEDARAGHECVVLTSDEARRVLRPLVAVALPAVRVLAYTDLYETLNVSPGAPVEGAAP